MIGHKVPPMDNLIRPNDLIRSVGVDKLLEKADRPFAEVTDPVPLMAKPFGNAMETPDLLYNLGLLFSSMKLGRTMTVVDFGAGTCWLSRCLNQMGCATISVDPSASALEIGRRMFREHPVMGGSVCEPKFLKFDGHHIDLPDGSVDRIFCFDSFHHVPNTAEVLREFGRILKTGGLAGFSEPGRFHSRSEQSQHEMRAWGVLENDIILEEIMEQAAKSGLTGLTIKLAASPHLDMPVAPYMALAGRRMWKCLFKPRSMFALLRLQAGLFKGVLQRSIFVLSKGPFIPDTRLSYVATGGSPSLSGARDLAYEMTCDRRDVRAGAGNQVGLRVRVVNRGTVRWLHDNVTDYAIVKLGVHLYDSEKRLLNLDHHRHLFPRDVMPGESMECDVSFPAGKPGVYNAVLDLVSEQVCWFDACGNRPLDVRITVE